MLVSGIYTLKNQILISLLSDIIFPREQWILDGNYFLNYFPESYWGVGPFTRNDDELTVLYTQANIEQAVLYQFQPSLFLGPYLLWTKVFNVKFRNDDGNRITSPAVAGAGGSTSTGFGFMLRADRRNSNMTPTRNHYIELSLLTNPAWAGSTYPYTTYLLDTRKYFDLNNDGRSVLALQSLIKLSAGEPPFTELSALGGDRINRGYYDGRYRDQNAAQFQAELRQNITGRLGFTLFAATGEVWNRFEDIRLDNYKWTAGAGLRFNLNKEDPTNLRVDFGIGKETSGFYLQFGEAF